MMKRKSIYFLILWAILTIPVLANTSFSVVLNGINYRPLHAPVVQEEDVYIALDDLTQMTYSTYTSSGTTYTLSIQGRTIAFTLGTRYTHVDRKLTLARASAKLVEGVVYVPISFLDLIEYPYTKTKTTFELTSQLPYSTVVDKYDTHTLIETEVENLETYLAKYLNKANATNLIKTAQTNGLYISLMELGSRTQLLEAFKSELHKLPKLEVQFRTLDLFNTSPVSTQLISYPATLAYSLKEGLTLNFNNERLSLTPLTTYNPAVGTEVNVTKSLDATIMRGLYEHYRSVYDLKDDIHFSPITTIQRGRTDSIIYKVYSDILIDLTHVYEVVLYKQVTANKITYIVDLIME